MTSLLLRLFVPVLSCKSTISPTSLPPLLLARQLKASASITQRATRLVSVFTQMEERMPTQTILAWPCTSAVGKMMQCCSGQSKTDRRPSLPWTRTLMLNWGCLLQEASPQVDSNHRDVFQQDEKLIAWCYWCAAALYSEFANNKFQTRLQTETELRGEWILEINLSGGQKYN